MDNVRLSLNALIYREGDWWIAHCLELDLVAEGEATAEAIESLTSLIEFQITSAMEDGDLKSIFRQAPAEIIAAFATAQDQSVVQNQSKAKHATNRIKHLEVRTLQPA